MPSDTDRLLARLGLAPGREPERLQLADDGVVPNSRLPVLIHRGDTAAADDAAGDFERLFAGNDWPPQWRAGIFDFHHYHATAHEVLGVFAGRARVQLGGSHGPVVALAVGDVLVLPAGTGHCRLDREGGFGVVGAYPANASDWDLCRADPAEHDAAVERIARVPLPPRDPVTGAGQPVPAAWR